MIKVCSFPVFYHAFLQAINARFKNEIVSIAFNFTHILGMVVLPTINFISNIRATGVCD